MKAYLTGDLWREMASSANARTAQLAEGLRAHNRAELLYPVDANMIFCRLPRRDHQTAAGGRCRLLHAGRRSGDGRPRRDDDRPFCHRLVDDRPDQVAPLLCRYCGPKAQPPKHTRQDRQAGLAPRTVRPCR